jgi:hypothetical protein
VVSRTPAAPAAATSGRLDGFDQAADIETAAYAGAGLGFQERFARHRERGHQRQCSQNQYST